MGDRYTVDIGIKDEEIFIEGQNGNGTASIDTASVGIEVRKELLSAISLYSSNPQIVATKSAVIKMLDQLIPVTHSDVRNGILDRSEMAQELLGKDRSLVFSNCEDFRDWLLDIVPLTHREVSDMPV